MHIRLLMRRSKSMSTAAATTIALVIGITTITDDLLAQEDAKVKSGASPRSVPTLRLPELSKTPQQTAELDDLQMRKQRSMDRLNHQAKELVEFLKAKNARGALATLQAEEKSRQRKIDLAEREQAAREQIELLRNPANESQAPPVPELDTPKEVPVPPPTVPLPTVPPPISEAPLTNVASPETTHDETLVAAAVHGPIDRLALATSLFGTASYRECLQTLEVVDRESLSAENTDWCDFLAASCYRKLGKLPEAESRYRKLLGQTEIEWLANTTRWWLDHMSEQQKLRTDLNQLTMNLNAWKEEIDALRTTN